MVTDKEVYLNAAVNQLGNFAENAHVTFRNDGAVFKPEVEQVAQKEHLVGIGFDAVKPPNEASFALKVVIHLGSTQVEVGSEIDFHLK